MPVSRRALTARTLLEASALAFLPGAGPLLRSHLANLDALRVALPPLPPLRAGERLFVLSPHPDDETLGAGGLVRRAREAGLAVRIGFLSNGDGSRTTQISQILRGQREKTLPSIARFRQGEALAAARALGVAQSDALFFGFPDGAMRAIWNGDFSTRSPMTSPFTGYARVEYERAYAPGAPYCRAALLDILTRALEEFAPTLVLTTHPRDTHLDHVVAYRACQEAIARLPAQRRPRLLAFLIHCGIWPVPNGWHPRLPLAPPAHLLRGETRWFSTPLSPAELAAKREALRCHATQLGSTPRYLHAFVRANELFGEVAAAT